MRSSLRNPARGGRGDKKKKKTKISEGITVNINDATVNKVWEMFNDLTKPISMSMN